MTTSKNVHTHEINKFSALAEHWWDPEGDFKTLHQVNPLRLQFIQGYVEIEGTRVVDVGCGGGILSEGLARRGASVVGIDLSEELVEIADLHSLESNLEIQYQKISAESLAEQEPAGFDCVTCMEMLEHVPRPESVISACASLVKPGGKVFFSTLNRNLKAYLLAIVGAEYLLRMIPKGTHDYNTFIRPSELAKKARIAGLELLSMTGIDYHPLSRKFYLTDNISVNYIAVFERSAD